MKERKKLQHNTTFFKNKTHTHTHTHTHKESLKGGPFLTRKPHPAFRMMRGNVHICGVSGAVCHALTDTKQRKWKGGRREITLLQQDLFAPPYHTTERFSLVCGSRRALIQDLYICKCSPTVSQCRNVTFKQDQNRRTVRLRGRQSCLEFAFFVVARNAFFDIVVFSKGEHDDVHHAHHVAQGLGLAQLHKVIITLPQLKTTFTLN